MTITNPRSLPEPAADLRKLPSGPIGDLYLELRNGMDASIAPKAPTIIIDPHYSSACGCPSCALPKGQ